MPFVRITMMPRSMEVKKALAKEIADAVMKHCNVAPDHTWIVFEEPPKSSWSFGGKLASE
ncbi:MAG: tautomerase family protein [Elusimicrobia bacterium]|nr:tautomerase family protein [Elusimicrobiota bacterium]MBI2915915.1 tautomerase family protein [Elusimicrobiota bacterium]